MNKKVSSPAPDDDNSIPEDILRAGKALQKVGTPFVTSIAVQKPRNLDKIVKAMDREAEYAGASFYYGWKDKKGNRIGGPSIGLANSLAREWTNCAVTVDFEETDETFIITPRFIDLEKGFQSERVFRQGKNVVQGNFDAERKLDMALQIGQSKAIRNVIVNAVPRWLVERAIEKAKEAVIKNIDPKKIREVAAKVVDYFKTKGIKEEQLVEKAGKPIAEWTTRDIADFQGDKKAIDTGEASVRELFPPRETNPTPDGPVDLTTALNTAGKGKEKKETPPTKPAAAAVTTPGEMTEEEKKKILEDEQKEAEEGGKSGSLFPKS